MNVADKKAAVSLLMLSASLCKDKNCNHVLCKGKK